MKTAHIETIGGVIRVFPEGKKYGDPYEYSAAFRTLAHDKVEVIGILNSPSPSQWRAIKKCLRENGFKTFVITRKREDGSTEVREHPT
jgi:hypothetical protein